MPWRYRSMCVSRYVCTLKPSGMHNAKVLARLKEQGQAVIFITHKLHEALTLGDEVSILRHGRIVGRIDRQEMRAKSHEELRESIVRMMFGGETPEVAEVAELREDVAEVE